ncbi:uncharacterized protein LOC113276224 [Papaver somniferum]|uniref:uncharacterized protein LOC113276224 n=1 Tax=Papaver somniferum TaxID=3469 RepID=UPI000E6FD852|nr:uncharacterized protein LOC113276224 [Papaver somniferum]
MEVLGFEPPSTNPTQSTPSLTLTRSNKDMFHTLLGKMKATRGGLLFRNIVTGGTADELKQVVNGATGLTMVMLGKSCTSALAFLKRSAHRDDIVYECTVTGVRKSGGLSNDVALIGESKKVVEEKLELWRKTLKSKGLKLSRTKTEYLRCELNEPEENTGELLLDGQPIQRTDSFRYLGSIIQSNGELDGDIIHRIQTGWGKWRMASGVLCDRKVPLKLKGKFYRVAIRPAMLYGAECWATNSRDVLKLHRAKMRMLRWACGHTRHEKIRNEYVRKKLVVAPIEEMLT